MRRLLSTGSPFETTYGYSRAVVDGDFCFVAGTTGYDYTTMTMPDDPAEQTRNIFKTIENTLREGGFELADLVRVSIFVTDRASMDPALRVCGEILGAIRPASSIFVVSGLLRPEMKVEIEATAKRSR